MKKPSANNIIWGLIIMGLGIGFLLDSLNILTFGEIISRFWPSILILIGLGELINGKRTSALIWILIGAILQLSALDIINANVWTVFWSVLLIWVGVNILLRSTARSHIERETGDFVSGTAIFGAVEKRIESKNFDGAGINAIFGGAKIDLRNATVAEKGAVIDALIIFGGGEILVPAGAVVKMETLTLFGGSEDKRREIDGEDGQKPVIRIQGTVLFGGIEIKD
jgi:predicted membrane protein